MGKKVIFKVIAATCLKKFRQGQQKDIKPQAKSLKIFGQLVTGLQ